MLQALRVFGFLPSGGESRVKGSPARPSESASSQQSRSSSEADPLSRCPGLFRKNSTIQVVSDYLRFDLEDADLTDKQKKQALNPHIELRECFYFHVKISGFITSYQGRFQSQLS